MPTKNLVVISVEEHPILTFDELCHAAGISEEAMQEMINFGVIEPRGFSPEGWRFDANHLRRIRTALHLQQDLEVNLAGIALVLDLLDQMERMRTQIELFHRHMRMIREK